MAKGKLAETEQNQVVLCYVAVTNEAEAMRIAERVVEERLAACGNIVSHMRSVYRWQGTLEKSEEAVLLLKTRRSLTKALTARLVELHSYEVPGVVVIPLEHVHEPYRSWVLDQTEGTN